MSTMPIAIPLRERAAVRVRPELPALLFLAAVLNLYALSRNGMANDYYAAAVRSMSTSWHAFLYGSFDVSGVQTVDKPPLALWVQALSVRVFGFHSLAMLVPQALMGMGAVALVYDLVRRPFGARGGLRGRPRAGAHADHGRDLAPQQPRRAARAVRDRGAVVPGARARGRAHEVAGVVRRDDRPGLRDEDGRRADRRARPRAGVAVGGAARPAAARSNSRSAASRWSPSAARGRC